METDNAARDVLLAEARLLVTDAFHRRFWPHRYIPNPLQAPDRVYTPELVADPDRLLPDVEDWGPVEDATFPVCSTFVCQGVRFVCRWRGGPGEEPRPAWTVRRRRRFQRPRRRTVEVPVVTLADVPWGKP